MVVILAPGAICLAASARYPVVANTLRPLPGSEDPEPEPDPESEPDVLHAVTPAHSVSAANTAVKRRMSDMMTISFDCGGECRRVERQVRPTTPGVIREAAPNSMVRRPL